jgi:hypothetical protein
LAVMQEQEFLKHEGKFDKMNETEMKKEIF